MNLITEGIIYSLAGAFAGLMSGILGIGGGIVVVPALLIIFTHNPAVPSQLTMVMASGTSLAVMMFTSQASIRAHAKAGDIFWSIYRQLMPGIIVGTVSGAILANFIPVVWLKYLLVIVLVFVAIKMLQHASEIRAQCMPASWVNVLASFIIGLKSGLLGLGGGLLIIPYLTYCGVDMRKIPAISALCTMTVSLIGTTTYILTGFNEAGLPPYSTGYVYWIAVVCVAIPSSIFAPLGARLTYRLPVKQLKYGFVVILLATAGNLLLNA